MRWLQAGWMPGASRLVGTASVTSATRSWLSLASVLLGTTDTCHTKTSRNAVPPHVTGFSSAPNRGARKVFAQAVESGRRYRINPSAGACLGVHRDSQRRLAKVIVVPPPGMITLDEAAIRAGVTRLNFDYHRKRGNVVGAEVRSHGPNGEKRSYIAEGFKLTIPKPKKRTTARNRGPSRPDPFRNGGAEDRHGTKDVQAQGSARPDPRRDADISKHQAVPGTSFTVTFRWRSLPAPACRHCRLRYRSRWGGPDLPSGIRSGYVCRLSSSHGSPIWLPARSVGAVACLVTASKPRCSRKATPIYGHGAGRARAVSSCTLPVSGLPL